MSARHARKLLGSGDLSKEMTGVSAFKHKDLA
jgi:hypothetical protein